MKIIDRTAMLGLSLVCVTFFGTAVGEEYRVDFRDGQFDRDTLVPIGFQSLYGLQLLRPESSGLRIVVPHHQGARKPSVGFLPTLKVHGDFEVAVSYELLTVDAPVAGAGAGANLYILTEESLHGASIRRCVTPAGGDAFWVHVSTRDESGKRRGRHYYFPAETESGVLCLRRTGTTLQFLVSEGGGDECRKVHEAEFGADTLGLVRVETTTDGSPTTTENRWVEFAMRADRLERVTIPLFGERPSPDPTPRDDRQRPLYLIGADGGNLRQLPSMEEYTTCGSPDWYRDGTTIAFDAWRPAKGESFRDAHVFVAGVDGNDPKDLGPGAMPSFSPDGSQIAFSCYDPRGVWTMNVDGSDRKLFDAEGWSARWCPRGNRIAYSVYDGDKANICILDMEKGEKALLLADDHRHYVGIGINFDWSPDGERIAFRGDRSDEQCELVLASAKGSRHGFEVRLREKTRIDLSWSPDGKTLLYSFPNSEAGGLQIYQLQVDSDEPPTPLKGQPQGRNNVSSAWSPDGETILFASSPVSN